MQRLIFRADDQFGGTFYDPRVRNSTPINETSNGFYKVAGGLLEGRLGDL